jgi:hypothetical protein
MSYSADAILYPSGQRHAAKPLRGSIRPILSNVSVADSGILGVVGNITFSENSNYR